MPLIRASLEERYQTVVCDWDPEAPGVALADCYYRVSTRDREGLLEVARKEKIDGIVANSEYAMRDVAYIAEQMGLVGNPESAVDVLSSKSGFRGLQQREGLFAQKFLTDEALERLFTYTQALSFPIVIKPDESSGSRSVAFIADPRDREAIRDAIRRARAVSRNGKAMAEECVPIPSQTVAEAGKDVLIPSEAVIEGEIFLHHGEILWGGLFHTVRSVQMPTIPMTYVFPLQEEENRVARLKTALTKAFRGAGIVHGEYNIESFFTAEGEPFLIELNPRQGGNDLPQYVWESCGIDLTRLLVTTAVGDDRYWNELHQAPRTANRIIHHMLYPETSGIFKGIRIDDVIAGCIHRMRIAPAVGDVVRKAEDGSDDIGYVDLQFEDTEEQMRAAMRIGKLIQIDIERV